MNHQQIVDRREELDQRALTAYKEAQKAVETAVGEDRRVLQERCGESGHVWETISGIYSLGERRKWCAMCHAAEPVDDIAT